MIAVDTNVLVRFFTRLDFADALHLALSFSCSRMVTFDKNFLKKAKGLSECLVSLP